METAHWSFSYSLGTALLAGLLFVAAVTLSALQLRRDRGRGARALVEALRWMAVFLLLATLFRPERVQSIRRIERPRIAVLCDASGSMATLDAPSATGVVSRAAWLAARKAEPFWTSLEGPYAVSVEDLAAPPAEPGPDDDPGTDLNGALDAVLQQRADLRAVLLVTDGDWNEGASPVAAATKLRLRQIPVFAVTAGRDRYMPDLELTSVSAPAYGLLDEHIALPFAIQSHLPREVRTTLTLTGPDGVAATKEIAIPAMAALQDTLLFVPRREGTFTYTLTLPAQGDEAFPENNTKSFSIALRREVLSVLLIDSTPRWEFRYLHNALDRDPGVRVRCLLLHPGGVGVGEGKNYLSAFPENLDQLSTYDVVFLGDIGVAEGQLTETQAGLLKGLVEQQGSGLVFLPGMRGGQATLAGTPLDDLLPVEADPDAPKGYGAALEARIELTTRGRDHLLTLLASTPSENEYVWKNLPGFYWYAPVRQAKPGADVLAVHAGARNARGRIPLLVTRPAGNGKVLYLGMDAAWRWRRGIEDTYHYRFWGQVVRWMSHQRHLAHREGLRVFFSPEAPRRGDRVFLHATVFDARGLPLADGTVQAILTGPDGAEERLDLAPEPGGWGVYTAAFVPRRGGVYRLEVACEQTGQHIETAITVVQPRREIAGRPARPEVLREIAALTGGAAGGMEDLDRIVQQIRLLPEPKPQEIRLRLWCHPLWLGLIAGLLALHWMGRKLLGTF